MPRAAATVTLPQEAESALALKRDAGHRIREICEIVGISRNTYYQYTRGAAPPAAALT